MESAVDFIAGKSTNHNKENEVYGVPGMESIVATVSGYHGTERFNLIKLITTTGANYVGAMARSTTHLVCWQFEGKKYEIAKNIGAHIVSHCWFQDCLREGRRLPEGPYTLQSGQEAGPVSWTLPAYLKPHNKGKSGFSNERRLLSDKSNVSKYSETKSVSSRSLDIVSKEFPGLSLLNENLFSSSNIKMKGSHFDKKLSGQGGKSRGKHNPNHEDISLQELLPCKKKKVYHNLLDYAIFQEKKEVCRVGNPANIEADSKSAMLYNSRSNPGSSSNVRVAATNHTNNKRRLAEPDQVESTVGFENEVLISSPESELITEEHNNKAGNNSTCKLAAVEKQTEIACCICWTESCSTRGVLHCGHRFCYSCIQEWADCKTSRGKVASCPLCKLNFNSIIMVESDTPDQKIYSQTIPCGPNLDSIVVHDIINNTSGPLDTFPTCYECHNHEPEDLLVSCQVCRTRWVHSYCLDPPLLPWTCISCKDLRMLYQRFR